MARGWESKAIADQQEAEEDRRASESAANTSAESRRARARVESLRLSRVRVLQQLENARHDAYRSMLMKALSDIERELEEAAAKLD